MKLWTTGSQSFKLPKEQHKYMRIAIDIDSTLHHYWDILSEVSVRRFGIELPYDEQFTWGITRLRPEQLALCIDESHSRRADSRWHPLSGCGAGGAPLARGRSLRAHHQPSRRRSQASHRRLA